jgi:hypothetical protein
MGVRLPLEGSSRKKARQPWGHRAVWEEMPDVGPGRRCADNGRPIRILSTDDQQRVAEFQCVESHPIQMPKASQMTAQTSTANTSVQPLTS